MRAAPAGACRAGGRDEVTIGTARCDLDRTPQQATRGLHRVRLTSWTDVSFIENAPCGDPVRPLRLLDMISAATHTYLVARRHVDLGRTRSMMCWHS